MSIVMRRMKQLFFLVLLALTTYSYTPLQEERPNVLFLVIEDSSPYLLPAYGNTDIKTPNIDWLAKNGVVFKNAFANAPYCSPARSTLISGSPATVYGNDIHREGRIQPRQYFLIDQLTKAGYFTINRGKTDYNISGKETMAKMKQSWSVNNGNASYNDPMRGDRPFFGQYNNMSVHMSRLTTITTKNRLECAVDGADLQLPPHVPDLPEVRADYALHLEGIQNLDQWVGMFINDLKERKLLDSTIIFFFSDHGGCLPRGKAFPFDTGHRIPLIVYAPEKYQHLLPTKPGEQTERMVSFDDFLPTALSLAGVETPEYVLGQAFMGEHQTEPKKYVHTFRTNRRMHIDPVRGVFDGRYQYLRFYTPYNIHGLTQTFQWQMPSQMAWDVHFMDGKASPKHSQYYEPHPVEALYDLQSDPWELENLAAKPAYQKKLKELRVANEEHIRSIKDLGFLSREQRRQLTAENKDAYTWVRANDYPLNDLISLAERASWGKQKDLPFFIENLQNARPSFRYWAINAIAYLAWKGELTTVPQEVYTVMNKTEQHDIAAKAAEILVVMGETEKGLQFLLETVDAETYSLPSLERLWQKVAPLEEALQVMAKEHKQGEVRTHARSLLIKLDKMEMDQLFEPKTIAARHRTYLNRVKNYMGKKP